MEGARRPTRTCPAAARSARILPLLPALVITVLIGPGLVQIIISGGLERVQDMDDFSVRADLGQLSARDAGHGAD